MTRLEKAYKEYPTGLIYEGCTLQELECCPYCIDMGEDNLDEYSVVEKNNKVIGCRGITCEECWNKEYSE
jgi:hypothetical protein